MSTRFVNGQTIDASDFTTSSAGASDDGKAVVLNPLGKLDSSFLKFGGSGADGALTIASGTTNIDCAGASLVVKNYTSVSITGTGKLTFSNPHTNGTTVIIKCTGNVTLTSSQAPMIDMSGMGASGGATVTSTGTNVAGNVGTAGKSLSNSKTTGGNGGVGPSSPGTGGATPSADTLKYSSQIIAKYPNLLVGAGGGSGQASVAGGYTCTSGIGGRGGGCLVIECAGAWNFTTTNGISVAGAVGGNGTTTNFASTNVGGGGGGGGGVFLGFYGVLTANSGTINVAGGTGGSSSAGAGNGGGGGGGGSPIGAGSDGVVTTGTSGGAGATGVSLVALNTEIC